MLRPASCTAQASAQLLFSAARILVRLLASPGCSQADPFELLLAWACSLQGVRWSWAVSCCTSGATSASTSSSGSRPTACGASSSRAGRGTGSTTARSTAWWATRGGQPSTGGTQRCHGRPEFSTCWMCRGSWSLSHCRCGLKEAVARCALDDELPAPASSACVWLWAGCGVTSAAFVQGNAAYVQAEVVLPAPN